MVVDPFTGTKKSPVARGKKREEGAENLNQIEAVYFTVDKRAVRDRYNLLAWLENWGANWKKRKKKTGGIETGMSSIEVALEEFSVLFLYSCILMSLFQVKIKKNSYGNFGIFKVSSHSRIILSSSITPSKQLSRRTVLASLKVDIFVWERNIAVAVLSENCLLLSILFLAGTTGLDLVFLIHPRRRPSSPSSYLKVPDIPKTESLLAD